MNIIFWDKESLYPPSSMSVRTYSYIRALVKKANAVSSVEHMIQREAESIKFEKENAKELAEAWSIVETHANKGCIRLFTRNHAVLQKAPIQGYFAARGFSFTDTSMEWWEEEKKEMK